MYKLYCIVGSTYTEISPLVSNITWSSNIDQLGQRLEFEVTRSTNKYFSKSPVKLGNIILLKSSEEILRSIVVSEERLGDKQIKYTCYDYGFYLNKSKGIYQFNNISPKRAIETILGDFKIEVGSIVDMETSIKKIYYSENISDIIKDILELAEKDLGQKYRYEMRSGKMFVEREEDLLIKGEFKIAENIVPYDINYSIKEPTRKRTIENMRNSIVVGSDNKVKVQVTDEELIKKYGVLQDVMDLGNKDSSQAKNIANNMLKKLGRIFEDNSVEMIGDYRVRSGRILEIDEPLTGMIGKYLVKSVSHTFKNDIHIMKVDLGVKEWME